MVGRDSQEEKTKRLLEERNREKEEEKAARERVKQQIAMVSSSSRLLSVSLKLTFVRSQMLLVPNVPVQLYVHLLSWHQHCALLAVLTFSTMTF